MRRPAYCPVHQHSKWCKHNGGVMGPTGYEAPERADLRHVFIARAGEPRTCHICNRDIVHVDHVSEAEYAALNKEKHQRAIDAALLKRIKAKPGKVKR